MVLASLTDEVVVAPTRLPLLDDVKESSDDVVVRIVARVEVVLADRVFLSMKS